MHDHSVISMIHILSGLAAAIERGNEIPGAYKVLAGALGALITIAIAVIVLNKLTQGGGLPRRSKR